MKIWETLEARGLNIERLGATWSVENRGGEDFLVIPFISNSKTVGFKFRSFSNPDRKWSAQWSNKPVAYNADVLKDDTLINEPLIICEGEIDCESAREAGFQRVISVPNGCAGASSDRTEADLEGTAAYDWLRSLKDLMAPDRVKEVILAVDGDEAPVLGTVECHAVWIEDALA
jgi:hypothetical protein